LLFSEGCDTGRDMKATITIADDRRARITGDFDDKGLDEHLSFYKSKFWFRSAAAQAGLWDGKTHLFHRAGGTFPLGLLGTVRKWLKAHDVAVTIEDKRTSRKLQARPVKTLAGGITLRPDQVEAVERMCAKERGIVHSATGCLAGDVVVGVNRAGKSFAIPLADLVCRFNGITATRQDICGVTRKRYTHWCKKIPTTIRYREAEGYVRLTRITAAYVSGMKETFVVRTDTGQSIRATKDHRFLTDKGWRRLAQLHVNDSVYVLSAQVRSETSASARVFYRVTGGLVGHPHAVRRAIKRGGYSVVTHRLVVEAALNGLTLGEYVTRLRDKQNKDKSSLVYLDPKKWVVHHIDENRLNNTLANLEVLSHFEHNKRHGEEGSWKHVTQATRLTRVTSIERYGVEPTFDLEVADVSHNFIANGFIVHNSGKTLVAIATTLSLGTPVTLFVTGRKKLVRQTRERFARHLGVELDAVGLILAGKWHNGTTGVYVAGVDTLRQPKFAGHRKLLYQACELLFIDECFPAGTLVDGWPIERMRAGDLVTAYNPKRRTWGLKRVTHAFRQRPTSLLHITAEDGKVVCTPNHPFLIVDGWLPAAQLVEGDLIGWRRKKVVDDTLVWSRVQRIARLEPGTNGRFGGACPDGYVYNLEVQDFNSYTANGFVVHNCHHTGATTWYRTLMYCNARYRFGLSGTPVGRSDGADLYLRACTGSVVARMRAADLIEQGIIARPTIYFIPIQEPEISRIAPSWLEVYHEGVVANPLRNELIAELARKLTKRKKHTLILVKELVHGRVLEETIPGSVFVHGAHSQQELDAAIESFEAGTLPTLIASPIFDEGIDIVSVNALINAAAGRSQISTLQRIGRGLRRKTGDNTLLVFDFYDETHRYLAEHAEERVQTCRKEKYRTFIRPFARVLEKIRHK